MAEDKRPHSSSSDDAAGPGGEQPSVATRQRLHKIKRARTRLMVCLLTLPVYVIAVWILLNNQQSTDSFMFMYMAVWGAFAVDMARRRCPSCGEQFFVRHIFLNLITRRCVHCGLSLSQSASSQERWRA